MKHLLIATAAAALLASGPVLAQGYVGIGVGEADTDSRHTSGKLYAGYQFKPMWGAELAYNDLRSYRGANVDSWTVAGTGTLPLTKGWQLFGKLGAAYNRADFAGADDRTEPMVGIGVGYSLGKNLGLRFEYEDFGELSGSSTRAHNLGLSLKYAM